MVTLLVEQPAQDQPQGGRPETAILERRPEHQVDARELVAGFELLLDHQPTGDDVVLEDREDLVVAGAELFHPVVFEPASDRRVVQERSEGRKIVLALWPQGQRTLGQRRQHAVIVICTRMAVIEHPGKRAAAEHAAQLVDDGMRVGLGTGSTVASLLPALAARGLHDVRYVATSLATAEIAAGLGLAVEPFEHLDRLDLAIDGADQIAPDLALIKGGGGAHVREKIVAAAAERFVVIAAADKLVPVLRPPVPIELLTFGLAATLTELALLGPVVVRKGAALSPDGGVIADLHAEPAGLAAVLDAIPGVVGHGLFAATLTDQVLIGGADGTVRSLAG